MLGRNTSEGVEPRYSMIVDADALLGAESRTRDDDMVSYASVYRGLSPWHGMRWK